MTDGELFDEIVKRGFFSETDAACIIHQIAQAVRYLHLHGIVHRDLKPENCLLSTKDEILTIKVADFGEHYFFALKLIVTRIVKNCVT